MPTATPASTARVSAERRRPASSASAAKNAAAVEECPLGNDGPRVAATGSIVGRARSKIALIVLVTSESPIGDHQQEHRDPPAGHADPFDHAGHHADHDHALGRGQQRDVLQDPAGHRPDVMVSAVRGERVKVCQRLAVANQHRECCHHDAGDDDGHRVRP